MKDSTSLIQDLKVLNNLPKLWRVLPFSKVISDVSGGNKKTKKGDLLEEGLIRVIDQGKELIAGYTDDKRTIVKTKIPHIVFGDHTRIIKYIDFPFAMGADGTKVLKAKSEKETFEKYIYYFFLTLNIPNTGYNRHFKYLKDCLIPLPPLETQKKIAAILDEADKLRQLNKQLIAKYEALTQSLFSEMFGDPLTNNLGFDFPKMKELCVVSQGMQIAIKNRFKEDGKNRYKYLTVAFLNGRKDGEFIENPRKSVVCHEDEILMTRTGNTGQVVTGVEGVFHNNFFKVDWKREIIQKDYFVAFLSNPNIRLELLKRASTTTIPDLSHGQFYDINVVLPPLALQNQFADRMKEIKQQKALAQEALQKSEDLFNSLLQKAFKGELVK